MLSVLKRKGVLFLAAMTLSCLALSGCAAALVAGGLVGGYAIAKNVDVTPKKEESKGWFK